MESQLAIQETRSYHTVDAFADTKYSWSVEG